MRTGAGIKSCGFDGIHTLSPHTCRVVHVFLRGVKRISVFSPLLRPLVYRSICHIRPRRAAAAPAACPRRYRCFGETSLTRQPVLRLLCVYVHLILEVSLSVHTREHCSHRSSHSTSHRSHESGSLGRPAALPTRAHATQRAAPLAPSARARQRLRSEAAAAQCGAQTHDNAALASSC